MRGTKRKKRDGVWEVRVYLGRDPITGNPKQLSRTVRGTGRDADNALRELIDKYGSTSSDGIGRTFGELLDLWLEECERLDRSPTTMLNYRSRVKNWIRPALGQLKLSRLNARHLDELYGHLKEEGLSASSIRNIHAVISSALHQAVRWGWIRENIADRARPPQIRQQSIKPPTVEAVRAVIAAADNRDSRLAPLLMLAALTGMRRAELCGLKWADVDSDRRTININRSVVVAAGGLAEKSTKTNRVRRVALDDIALLLLRAHRDNVDGWASQADVAVVDDGYVFSPYLDGSKPFRPDNVTSFFIRVRNSLGLEEIRLHDLRHFTATQLIGAGVDVRTVANRLGHSDPSLTLRVYSHALEERDRAAAAVMGRVLSSVGEDKESPSDSRRLLRRRVLQQGAVSG